jgi:hypothetical protein
MLVFKAVSARVRFTIPLRLNCTSECCTLNNVLLVARERKCDRFSHQRAMALREGMHDMKE